VASPFPRYSAFRISFDFGTENSSNRTVLIVDIEAQHQSFRVE